MDGPGSPASTGGVLSWNERRPRRVARNLHYPHGPHGRATHRARDPRRQPPLPRRRGARLRRQVGDRLRRGRRRAGAREAHEAARRAARAVRALARDRRGHRLLLAQPAARRASSARRPAPTSRPACSRRSRRTRGGSASTSRPPPATPPSCRSRTPRSTSCSATPCCTTCPTSSARSPSSRACCAPAGRCSSPASRRARATASPPGRSAPRCAPRRCGARRSARGPPCGARATAAAPSPEDAEHALESVVDVHAFDPADLERLMQGAGLHRHPRPRRGAAGQLVRLVQPHARGEREPRRHPVAVVPVRVPRLPRAAEGRPRAARAAAAAAGLLQPDDRGAEAVSIDVARARADTPGTESVAHLNNAGAALPPAPVLDAVVEHLRREAEIGGYEAAAEREDRVEHTYDAIARLIGAERDEIAIVENATRAWDMAFYSLQLQRGRPHPHHARRVRQQLHPDAPGRRPHRRRRRGRARRRARPGRRRPRWRAMLDERVKLVSLVHVPTQGGLVQPAAAVGAACRAAGVPLLLDACQSVGQMPVDVGEIGCDMLSATGRKFLRGPRGTGFLYVRRGLIEQLEPPFLDLHAAEWQPDGSYRIRPDARRFENWESERARRRSGSASRPTTRSRSGLEAIRARVRALADELRARLAALPGVTVHDLGEERSRDRHLRRRRPPDRGGRRRAARARRQHLALPRHLRPPRLRRPRPHRPRARVAALLQRRRRPRPAGRRRRSVC